MKSVEELIPYLCQKLCELLLLRTTRENLKDGQFQVIVDFAKNYSFTVQDAIPGFNWNNDQATVYNIIIYYKDNTDVKYCSLVIISDCLSHDTIAVYSFHKILIDYLRSKFTSVNKILYFSDGAPQQYKNFKNVINLAHHKRDFDIDAEWNFYATAHGKGPCDGIGAAVKRAAVRASLQAVDNNHILTANDLFNWLSTTDRLPSIDFRFSGQNDYHRNKRFLAKRFKLSSRIEHLQDQHYLLPIQDGIIRAKQYSHSLNYKDYKIF